MDDILHQECRQSGCQRERYGKQLGNLEWFCACPSMHYHQILGMVKE